MLGIRVQPALRVLVTRFPCQKAYLSLVLHYTEITVDYSRKTNLFDQ